MTEVKKVRCFFCEFNCAALAHVEDGRVVKVEGNPEHPVFKGFICERARRAPKWLYHPDQLMYPLKRIGGRGQGKWQRISWEQALDEIAGKLAQLKESYGAETLLVNEGTYRCDHTWARTRFMNLFGNPHNLFCPGTICFINAYNINLCMVGCVNIWSDLENSKCVVLWGQNPAETELPPWVTIREGMRRRDVKLIVIDPKITKSARHADIHLRLRPGTDTALALGWINVIISEGLYDKDFVEKWTYGFDKLREAVKEYTPERVAEITWLKPHEIVESARLYATTKPAGIEKGVATDQIGLNSSSAEQARVILRAITGNIDVPGGNRLSGPFLEAGGEGFIYDTFMELSEKCCPPEQRGKQIGSDKYKLMTWHTREILAPVYEKVRGLPYPQLLTLMVPTPLVMRSILSRKPYPVTAMITYTSNPLMWAGNTKLVFEALTSPNLELHVVLEYWLTPTAQLADYVLPAASWLERPMCTTYTDFESAPLGGERAVEPLGERREDYQFWRGLGIRLGQEEDWPWESLEDVIKYRIAPLGISYEEFTQKGGPVYEEAHYKYTEKGFATPTGKVELYSTVLEKLGYDPLPYYEEPPESPVRTPELLDEYPLILISGSKFMPMFHSEHRQFGIGHREKHPYPLAYIHPETARPLEIEDGDWIYIETRRGRIKQMARVTDAILPGVIDCEHGWWFPERNAELPELFGALESNANILTLDDPALCDPMTGGWCNRGLLCKVYKA